jgi:hypothetical protein
MCGNTVPAQTSPAAKMRGLLVRRVVALQVRDLLRALGTDAEGLRVEVDRDPVTGHRVGQQLRRVALLVTQEHRLVLDDGHLRSEPREGLRELAPRRAAADDQQPRRAFGHLEDVLVGQVPRLLEAGNGGTRCPRAGRDQRRPEAQREVSHRDRIGPGEARVTHVQVDAGGPQPLGRRAPGEARADGAHPLHDGGEIDVDAGRGPASERLGVSHLAIEPRGADERLRGDAPHVQARASEEITLHERDAGAPADRGDGGDESRRPRADDEQIVRIGAARHSHPPSNPARCSPARMAGHSRIKRQISPER